MTALAQQLEIKYQKDELTTFQSRGALVNTVIRNLWEKNGVPTSNLEVSATPRTRNASVSSKFGGSGVHFKIPTRWMHSRNEVSSIKFSSRVIKEALQREDEELADWIRFTILHEAGHVTLGHLKDKSTLWNLDVLIPIFLSVATPATATCLGMLGLIYVPAISNMLIGVKIGMGAGLMIPGLVVGIVFLQRSALAHYTHLRQRELDADLFAANRDYRARLGATDRLNAAAKYSQQRISRYSIYANYPSVQCRLNNLKNNYSA